MPTDEVNIKRYYNEGNSVSSISRLTGLSTSTVARKIKVLAGKVYKPVIKELMQEYEIDELCTYIGKNTPSSRIYVMYALSRATGAVVDLVVGARNTLNIKKLIDSVLKLSPIKVYTDRLNIYPELLPNHLHCTKAGKTNHIERKHLTLRTHLKRLSEKTICYSKSVSMLEASLRIYFWG